MAVKLKKRALAEYCSQIISEDDENIPSKRLKLPVGSSLRHSTTSSFGASRSLSICSEREELVPPSATIAKIKAVESAAKNGKDISALVSQLSPIISSRELDRREVLDAAEVLIESIKKGSDDEDVRAQVYDCLRSLIEVYCHFQDAKLKPLRLMIMEKAGQWVNHLRNEKSDVVKSAILQLLAIWFDRGGGLSADRSEQVYELSKICLKNHKNHLLKVHSLKLLGSGITALSRHERSLGSDILTLACQYTHSQDPRARHAAFESLLKAEENGFKLDTSMYADFCRALNDDYEKVRSVSLNLIFALAATNPEEMVKVSSSKKDTAVRLVDDSFGKICGGMNDLSIHVREMAVRLMGRMEGVSQKYLEQTLDKKLMSNMRVKKSAHEREAKMVKSGEWSSGKKWADDDPREEVNADEVNLMSIGACGAFVLGLEDEFMVVRTESIESLTRLSIRNPELAVLALDFLVDMFNDEIEGVRLKAIESLTRIAHHVTLQVHQLETIMSALDDFSMTVREKLHQMLQSSTFATKDGLMNVINKLLENLKRYPQDKRSILMTFRKLGYRHADLTLPLVTQLLEIHPFFDTAEPDIEQPSYLCILVLVFNASFNSPTLEPLLDHHTRRHFHYLKETYPYLVDPVLDNDEEVKVKAKKTNTLKFFGQVLQRVKGTLMANKAVNSVKVLDQAVDDLQRLSVIESPAFDSAAFAKVYVECQMLITKCLSSEFWVNPHQAMRTQNGDIVLARIDRLFNHSLELQGRYINLGKRATNLVKLLNLRIMALHLVFLVKASNKSALHPTETFLKEVENLQAGMSTEDVELNRFFGQLVRQLSANKEDRKPGVIVRIIQPLLLKFPVPSLSADGNDLGDVAMSRAVIYEPTGNNEIPLKYTAGMVLAVPVDCDLFNVVDIGMVRLCVKTPDQKVMVITPKRSEFCSKGKNCYRLFTNAFMSHPVWSEALHVLISVVLEMPNRSVAQQKLENTLVPLCDPVKVYVFPKPIKRGL